MAGELTHIVKTGFSQTNSIYYGSSSIASVYYGSNLIWQKSTVSYSIVTASNGAILMRYTPSNNVTLATITTYSQTTTTYNYFAGIYLADGTTFSGVPGSSGVTIHTDAPNTITVGGYNFYKHVKDYSGTGPSLTGGTAYYLYIGERYANSTRLSIDGNTSGAYADVYEWSLGNSSTTPAPLTPITGVTILFGVTTV